MLWTARQGVVQSALDKMIEANRTGCSIMIAHRLATVKKCDRILVMDYGVIKEQGSHNDLLQIPIVKADDGSMVTGWYHDLWDTQMGKSEDSARLQRLEQQVKELQAENFRLRGASLLEMEAVKKQRLGHIRRSNGPPPPIEFKRSQSHGMHADTPPALSLERYVTAF